MRTAHITTALALLIASTASAQIRVNPNGVNINTQSATTVFLVFGGLRDQVPVEAFWCGRLISAAPARGNRCDPATLFGQLPIRYDRSRVAGGTFTDIMSIPPSVSRRAYEAATQGENSSFFYVRRFRSATGGPDEYVAVTCRMAGGGARVPFALTHVTLKYDVDSPVPVVASGSTPLPFSAEILYTGTGRLRGRWEVALPGEELPTADDLMTEASLPPAERGLQRRYTRLASFNVFLPPTGRVTLPGPDPALLPTGAEGQYLVLLRVEVSDDKEGDVNLSAAGAGQGVFHNGAVAGFPMPTLRYVVGQGAGSGSEGRATGVQLLAPSDGATVPRDSSVMLSWDAERSATLYRVEMEPATGGASVLTAVVAAGVESYAVPPFALAGPHPALRWRVVALDARGGEVARSGWRWLALRTQGATR